MRAAPYPKGESGLLAPERSQLAEDGVGWEWVGDSQTLSSAWGLQRLGAWVCLSDVCLFAPYDPAFLGLSASHPVSICLSWMKHDL